MKQADLDRNEIIDRDEVLKMARQAGIVFDDKAMPYYERFAKLVADVATAKEREACIQIVENEAYQYSAPVWAFEIVNAIKDRGEQHESKSSF